MPSIARPIRNLVTPALAGAILLVAGAAAENGPVDAPMAAPMAANGRIAVGAAAYPWSAVGRVNAAGRGHCSGTLVGPDLVVTAAHCLYNRRAGRWLPPGAVHFVAGYEHDSFRAQSQVAAYFVPAGFRPEAIGELGNFASDWAVLTLAAPIGEEVGFLGVLPLDRARLSVLHQTGVTFAQAGYPSQRAHVMSVDFDCKVTGFLADRPLLLHRCASGRGDSGGPVLAMEGDAPRVVAIHNGRIEADQGQFGIAVPAASFHDAIRERLGSADGRAGGRLVGRRPHARRGGAFRRRVRRRRAAFPRRPSP